MTTVLINGNERMIETDELTYRDICLLVFGFEGWPRPTIQYARGGGEKQSGTVLPGQSVVVRDGTIIDVVFTGRS